MRGNLPLTLAVSLAVHVGIAAGVAVSCFHVSSPPTKDLSGATPPPSVQLLRAVAVTDAVKTPTATQAAPRPIASTAPATVPAQVPLQPVAVKPAPAAVVNQPAALALEANPNANIRALPPESALCPNPAPILNGADGIVFILDISGSMYEPYAGSTRLAFAREALAQRIRALKDGTPFAITLYAKTACNSGPLVAASNDTREAAVRYIQREVDCGGGTDLPAGLASAIELHTGSLIVVSDGDWNMSASTIMTQAGSILGSQGHCPSLTIIGIAPRANTSAEPVMQGLADQQGGTYGLVQLNANSELVTSAANVTKPASATR